MKKKIKEEDIVEVVEVVEVSNERPEVVEQKRLMVEQAARVQQSAKGGNHF